jgi:hypothetical protein
VARGCGAGSPIALPPLHAELRAGKAGRVLAIVDAPLPGASDEGLARLTSGNHVTLLVAAGPGEAAHDFVEAERALFSYLLVEGARGSPSRADANRDGTIALGELARYLARKVAEHVGLEGRVQSPRLYRAGKRIVPGDPGAAGETEPWLPDLRGADARGQARPSRAIHQRS